MTLGPAEPIQPYGRPDPAGHARDPRGPLQPPSNRDLIDQARDLAAVAAAGDHGELSQSASALLDAFVRHAETERPKVLQLPPLTARFVERGQQRVVDRLVSLVLEADLAEEPCRCVEHAREAASLLELQIISEEWDQSPG